MMKIIIPKKLADNLLEYIDLDYLKATWRTPEKENYLSHIDYMNLKHFEVEWSGGGTYGSCFSDELREVDADEEPEMHILDRFLEKYYPTLEYNHYDYIKSFVVEDTSYENDYYGGSTTSYSKTISIEQLAEALALTAHKDENDYVDFELLFLERSEIISHLTIDNYASTILNLRLNEKLSEELDDTSEKKQRMKV